MTLQNGYNFVGVSFLSIAKELTQGTPVHLQLAMSLDQEDAILH